jgi:hypothetical protein
MKTSNSSRNHKKKQSQKMLLEFDKKIERHCKSIEDCMFDSKTRNETLNGGEFIPPSGTLFEAIFKELKRREEREKKGHLFTRMISRFREHRADRQLAKPTQNA